MALALLAVAAMTAPSGWGPRPTSLSHGGFTVVALLAGVVVLALEQGPTTSWLVRALAARPLAWLGKISYGFYLWHFPVVAHWGDDLTGSLGRWPAILAVAAISVALAAASYYLVERPIQRRRRAASRPDRMNPPDRRPALAAVAGQPVLAVAAAGTGDRLVGATVRDAGWDSRKLGPPI